MIKNIWTLKATNSNFLYTTDDDGHHRQTMEVEKAVTFDTEAMALDYAQTNDIEDYMPWGIQTSVPDVPPVTPIICVQQTEAAERRQLIANVAGQLHAAESLQQQLQFGFQSMRDILGSAIMHTDRDGAQRFAGFSGGSTYVNQSSGCFNAALMKTAIEIVDSTFQLEKQRLDSINKP